MTIRAAGALIGLVIVAAFAKDVPILRDDGERNVSNWPGDQAEVSIAVDRNAPDRVVLASMNNSDGRLMVAGSSDGGAVWTRSFLGLPQGASHYADPMVAFDSAGVVHLVAIPVSGASEPLGIDMRRSADGGRSWSPPLRISKAQGRDDKVALAVDAAPLSPFEGRVYVAWKWGSGSVFVAVSRDSGATFSRPRLIDILQISGLDLAVSAAGDVFLAANDASTRSIRVWRSSDGGESFDVSSVVSATRSQYYTRQASHCARQSLVHASIAVDESAGSRRGRVYVTWSDRGQPGCPDTCDVSTGCNTRVFVSHSDDRGLTWRSPYELPDQSPASDRFFQWSRVDPQNGDLYVVYKDTRLDPSGRRTDTWLSRSSTGGASWDTPIRVSGASSDATSSYFQYGDYQGLAVARGRVYAAWADYRDSAQGEIFVGRLRLAVTSAAGKGARRATSLVPMGMGGQ